MTKTITVGDLLSESFGFTIVEFQQKQNSAIITTTRDEWLNKILNLQPDKWKELFDRMHELGFETLEFRVQGSRAKYLYRTTPSKLIR